MLYIRFDGPPSHESGRFIEVERDETSISYGEWVQDGDDWLLVIPDTEKLEAVAEAAREILNIHSYQGFLNDEDLDILEDALEALDKEERIKTP